MIDGMVLTIGVDGEETKLIVRHKRFSVDLVPAFPGSDRVFAVEHYETEYETITDPHRIAALVNGEY